MAKWAFLFAFLIIHLGPAAFAQHEWTWIEDRGDRVCEQAIDILRQAGIELSPIEAQEIRSQKSCQAQTSQRIIVAKSADGSGKDSMVSLTGSTIAPASMGDLQLKTPTHSARTSINDLLANVREWGGSWGGILADLQKSMNSPREASPRFRVQQLYAVPDSEIPLQRKPPLGLFIDIPLDL